MNDYIIYILLAVTAVFSILSAILCAKNAKGSYQKNFDDIKETIERDLKSSREENAKYTADNMKLISSVMSDAQKQSYDMQDKRLSELSERFKTFSSQNEQKLENIRVSMESKVRIMQDSNEQQLEKIRNTVDEKLQKTLDDKLSQSFNMVSERLEQVYKGLGEMQNLAVGVGDLKKVLSNVKTRGILGEIQLGAILEQILSPEQYDTNVVTVPDSRDAVEFAIKLPGDGDDCVYLPIDSKFPADVYSAVCDAYESGDSESIAASLSALDRSIKNSAKTIHDKYIAPPHTTDFAIMFLPFEGLYAEVVKRGLLEVIQRDYKITVAGPTTMAATLNSLQMGFKTLAIQKHTSEVWNVLGAVKTEFEKFHTVLESTQNRLNQANNELEKLVGTRTRKIRSALKSVGEISADEAAKFLSDNDNE